MGVLTLKEEIILSALMMLGGSSRGAPVRKMVIEISKKRDCVRHSLQSYGSSHQ